MDRLTLALLILGLGSVAYLAFAAILAGRADDGADDLATEKAERPSPATFRDTTITKLGPVHETGDNR